MAGPPTNLPFPLTSFIGREGDLAAVRQRLAASRLLTLVGTGGVGKTRLALEAAAEALDTAPDGAWLVELAAVSEPDLVTQAVASRLGVAEQPGRPLLATLSEACRPRAMLLVLDTCEHLIGPCAELAGRLLGSCPRLRILATSRAPLGIAGESVWDVRPLAVPAFGSTRSADAVADAEAVRLFVDRASRVLPGFGLTDRNAPAIVQICRRVDGVPLALEMAAAWARTLTVEQIAARLDDRFRLLAGGDRTAPPRQQTLRAAVAWSCDLLSPAQRTLFTRLAVFSGGCTLDEIEVVCAGEGLDKADVLPLLAHLVDASLVTAEEVGDRKRYRLLETLRAFAREELAIDGEAERISRRHARHFLALAEEAEPALWGPDMAIVLEPGCGAHSLLADPRTPERRPTLAGRRIGLERREFARHPSASARRGRPPRTRFGRPRAGYALLRAGPRATA
jgi:predicted ATPase